MAQHTTRCHAAALGKELDILRTVFSAHLEATSRRLEIVPARRVFVSCPYLADNTTCRSVQALLRRWHAPVQLAHEPYRWATRSQATADAVHASTHASSIAIAAARFELVVQDSTLTVTSPISMQSRSARKHAVISPSPVNARQASAQFSLTAISSSQACSQVWIRSRIIALVTSSSSMRVTIAPMR